MISRRTRATKPGDVGADIPGDAAEGIRVLARAGAILALLEQADAAVPLGVIARTTGLNKTTVHRILASLVSLRLVEPGPLPATYQLGIWAFRLGASVQRRLDVRTRAIPHLIHLNERTEETTYLCIRDGTSVLCVERMEGKHVASLRLKVGGSLPLNAGAASRVFLASLPDTELHSCLAGDWPAFTSATMTDRASLLADVQQTREQGYVLSEEDVTDGVCALGAPVLDAQSATIAAVSISGVVQRFREPRLSELVKLVTDAARAISIDLGYHPGNPQVVPTGTTR